MTNTQVSHDIRPAPPDPTKDHWVCCRNDNITLCGFDATGLPWVDFNLSGCVVCDELIEIPFCSLDNMRPCPHD